jgi:RimJ/RimL family protein N-acetyltransferase
MLYDHLIEARTKLTVVPNLTEIIGKKVIVRPFTYSTDFSVLLKSCDGSAIYNESSYDPARIWGWLNTESIIKEIEPVEGEKQNNPSISTTEKNFFTVYIDRNSTTNQLHLVIVDQEINKPIGMLSLLDNSPRDLSIRIGNIWITPAYQGLKRSHEATYELINWFLKSGYRRVVFEIDERHLICRKFIERCGFQLEAILRKHRIVHQRNRNTALYVLLNSDWPEVEARCKAFIGYDTAVVQKIKIASLHVEEEITKIKLN